MSRPLRLESAGALSHVTARGNAREDNFRDDVDRASFLDLLGRKIAQQHWRLCAYCLMGNHYHLLIETTERNSTRGMQRLNRSTRKASTGATDGWATCSKVATRRSW
jgi:putative transposase